MATGSMIRVKSRDGFELDAYHVKAEGPRKGGVIVIQEIFGLSDHIKEMTERFGAAGYEAIAHPCMTGPSAASSCRRRISVGISIGFRQALHSFRYNRWACAQRSEAASMNPSIPM